MIMERNHTIRALLFALAMVAFGSLTVFGQEGETTTLQLSADEVSYAVDSAQAHAEGDVEISYGAVKVTCREAYVNQETRDYSAEGGVVVTIEGRGTWKAPSVRGNLETKTIDFGPFRLDTDVWHVGGEGGGADSDGTQRVQSGWMSTCDLDKPHYRLQAKEIIYYPEDKTFTAKHATAWIGSVPVFYFPYLHGSTDNTSGTIIRPGYSGKRGAYLRLGRVWQLGVSGNLQFFIDGMTKRGIALGQTTEYATETREIVTNLYGLHDRKPAETEKGFDRRFKSQDDRFRVKAYWRENFSDSLALRINVDYLSDISMLDDWFRHDWRHWGQPKSFATLSYDKNWIHAALTARPRLNTFNTVGEKLPELTVSIPRTAIYDLPIVYSSENSAGYYTMQWRKFDRDRSEVMFDWEYNDALHNDPDDYGAFRADTLHTIQAPLDLGDFLTLTPRASFRATSYSRTSRTRVSENELADWIDADNPDEPRGNAPVVSKYDSDGGAKTRIATEVGLEGRSRLLGDWFKCNSSWLQFTDLRHVVEPYFNYTYAGAPSVDRDNIYFFDEIDRLQRQNFLRIGLDQRLHARNNEGETRTLISLENYLDIHHAEGDETGRHWGDFGTCLTLRPLKDFSVWGTLLHDIGAGDIQRGEAGFSYGSEDYWHFSMKYIYRNRHLSRSAYSMGSTLADFTGESSYIKRHFQSADTIHGQINIPLNSKTSLEIAAEYDFEKNNLEEHHYYLTRELHCWTVVAGFGWDDHDFEMLFLLRLNAFPKVKLNLNI